MTSWVKGLAQRYLGIDGLAFTLTPSARRHILVASALPLVDVCALLLDLYIDLRFDTFGSSASGGELPEA
jgi:hypothetical protein